MKKSGNIEAHKKVAVIVAHPDDETLWCGGLILSNPHHEWFIACLSRENDFDRAPKFKKALTIFKAGGRMNDLDDSPLQPPLSMKDVKTSIMEILPNDGFDLIITHNPSGEYTRHRRHEEVSKAVIELWYNQRIRTKELWTFAYEDGDKKYLPIPQKKATIHKKLTNQIFDLKYKLITQTYGFLPDSFEALSTPKEEAFWKFETPLDAFIWLKQGGIQK
ncbi:PIG-L family deacetylase [Christiangramia fulva]|uniref:PIG-L family deacetylase n=1 Tax=Christiangramia fulva TaxID=2126553 RepID=A0A2R3Z4B5_9FLAO|nr:PIG-L family deacetylase [Christiangramia fulva]AVR45117.1 PIG-L family deacetylase [Christiangramia fulva]